MHDPEVLAFRVGNWVDVWHVDPEDGDCFDTCPRDSHWQWHVHHWQVSFPRFREWRRWLFTRCEWCGGKSRKGDRVDISTSNWGLWTPLHTSRFGTHGAMHSDCSSVASAHRHCLCDDPGLSHGDYGQCAFCSGFRAWRSGVTDADRMLAALPAGSRIPEAMKPELKRLWKAARAAREANDA